MTATESALRLVYAANILVAGAVGTATLFAPMAAARNVFEGVIEFWPATRIIGAFWLAIAVMSVAGLVRPFAFIPILVLQLLYKGGWLLAVAVPALIAGRGHSIPTGVSISFAVWVAVLPFVIPWQYLLNVKGPTP